MSDITITFAILVVMMAMFIWNKFPAVVVAVGAALAFYFAGILDFRQTLGGFGDPTVILIASLFVIGAGLEASGVGAWAGQILIQRAGASRTRLLFYILLLVTGFTAVIGVNGAVAALVPLVIVIAVRTATAPSKLLIPMMCVGHAAALLTLLGTPVNPAFVTVWQDVGLGHFGFFEFAIAGVPLVVGTTLIVLLLGDRLLPEHRGAISVSTITRG